MMDLIFTVTLLSSLLVDYVLTDSFSQEILDRHNKYRAEHGAEPLKYDDKVAAAAQEWADRLLIEGVCKHRDVNKQYGENLLCSSGSSYESGRAVDDWYNEIKLYDFTKDDPDNFKEVGHFTQVVWKGSRLLGCGRGRGEDGTYIVCNYDPPGNIGSRYRLNVLPKQKQTDQAEKPKARQLKIIFKDKPVQ